MRNGLPPVLLAAWLLAALVCGVALVVDEHFTIRAEGTFLGMDIGFLSTTYRFGCFAMTAEGPAESDDIAPVTLVEFYADGPTDAEFRRLRGAGAVLFYLACAAPVLCVIASCWRGASPAFRHVLFLLAGVAPLVALQCFERAVELLEARFQEDRFGPGIEWAFSLHTAPTTWAARVAWPVLVVVAAFSWWRAAKARKEKPVDTKVFE